MILPPFLDPLGSTTLHGRSFHETRTLWGSMVIQSMSTHEYDTHISESDARDVAEDIRLELNEVAQYGIGDVNPLGQLSYDDNEYHHQMCRLYVEWALEHVQELDEDRHPYASVAESDLKNIIFHLD